MLKLLYNYNSSVVINQKHFIQQFEQIFQELYYLSIVGYINFKFTFVHWMLTAKFQVLILVTKNPTKKYKTLGTAKFKSFQKSFLILEADKTIDKIQ